MSDPDVTAAQEAILEDVTDRRGWGQEWDQFDAAAKREVKKAWAKLLQPIFDKARRDARNEALEESARKCESEAQALLRACNDANGRVKAQLRSASGWLERTAGQIRAIKVASP